MSEAASNVSVWAPTVSDLFKGMIAVLSDQFPHNRPIDAMFLHGSPVTDDLVEEQLLKHAADLYHRGRVRHIVLNGISCDECEARHLAYRGCERWQQILADKAVPTADILMIQSSAHTGAESHNLLALAKGREWKNLAICSQAFHQLRCFLQIIALMPEVGWKPAVFNAPAPAIPWAYQMKKPVMQAGSTTFTEDIAGPLTTHIQSELERIVTYAQQPTPSRPFIRNATLEEMFVYLDERKSM